MALSHSVAFVLHLMCTVGVTWLDAKSLLWGGGDRKWWATPTNSQRSSGFCSASQRPIIPQAATRCKPRPWSFSTKFKLNKFCRPSLLRDELPPPSFALAAEPEGLVLSLQCTLWWGWREAEMPRCRSSCRSPSDAVAVFVAAVQLPASKCCWWGGDDALMSSQFRQDGRPRG